MAQKNNFKLRQLLASYRPAYFSVLGFSAIVNLLMLAPSWYMLQVYDRVLTSHDITTLLGLSLIVVFLYFIYALLERYRGLVLVQVAQALDDKIAPLLQANILNPSGQHREEEASSLSDLNSIKNFLTGQPILALLDTPWVVIYLLTIFLLHPALGWLAVASSCFLLLIALLSQISTKKPSQTAQEQIQKERLLVSNALAASDSIRVMGMNTALLQQLKQTRQAYLNAIELASSRGVNWSALSKFFRTLIQSSVLGIGAYLAIQNQMSAGMMIAASILLGRTLSPIEALINSWKPISEFKKAFSNLENTLEKTNSKVHSIELARPTGKLELKQVLLRLRPHGKATLNQVSLQIKAGSTVAIIGPSGAGKTSLLKTLAGIITPTEGQAFIDGSDLAFRDLISMGQYVGYLSQSTDLMAGKISENIARFADIDNAAVLKAAQLTGAHQVALSLPEGYETILSDYGQGLSEGQKRKIALARALYKVPAIVFLDEPGTGLDDASLMAVIHSIQTLKASATTLVFTTHQPRLAQLADYIILMVDGQIRMQGPSQEIMAQLHQA